MLKELVTNSPFKTAIEKGSPATGSGATQGTPGGTVNTKNMTSVQKIAAGLKQKGGVFGQ